MDYDLHCGYCDPESPPGPILWRNRIRTFSFIQTYCLLTQIEVVCLTQDFHDDRPPYSLFHTLLGRRAESGWDSGLPVSVTNSHTIQPPLSIESYWKDPGPTNTWLVLGGAGRLVAFIEVVVLSTFPFTFAPELLIVTAGEMQSPRRNLPKAANRYFYRLVFFYIGSVLAIGIICPYNDARLTDSGVGAKSSAFVVGIGDAGIKGLGSLINAIILTSAWSSGNSFLYMSSRSLYSLAVAGDAPKIFKKCSKHGVPYVAVGTSTLFCSLAYLNCAHSSSLVFSWFVNLTNTSGLISWICCSVVYIRFRRAYRAQALSPDDIPYQSSLQPYGAWIAIVAFTILVLINGFNVFFPGQFSASSFLTAYVGIPSFLAIYLGHRVLHWNDAWVRDPKEVDLHTGIATVLSNEHPDAPMGKWRRKLGEWFM